MNHSGAYFANFKNSQKIEEKSYGYNFFTNVITTKRTFWAAKEKFWGQGHFNISTFTGTEA